MPGSVPLDCGRRMSGADMFVESPAEAPNAPLWVSLKLADVSEGAGGILRSHARDLSFFTYVLSNFFLTFG